jgi:hypothetical protein
MHAEVSAGTQPVDCPHDPARSEASAPALHLLRATGVHPTYVAAQCTVCDLPAVIEAGCESAKTRRSDGAEFHLELRRCRRRRSALYLRHPAVCARNVGRTRGKPRRREAAPGSGKPHRIVGRRDLLTPQSLGPDICPYRVQNREAIVTGMEQEGSRVKGTLAHPSPRPGSRWIFAGTRLKQFSYPATDRIPSG